MQKYCYFIDEKKGLVEIGVGCSAEYYKEIGMKLRDVQQSEVDNEWYVTDKCPSYTEEEKKQKERDRISHLKCTKRVLVLMLEQIGLNYFTKILPLIKTNQQAELEWELCIELERANPLLNLMGAQLGIQPTQIDNLFKYANGEISQEEFLNVN